MDISFVGLLFLVACTETVSSYRYCYTSYSRYELCSGGCCWNELRLYYDCCSAVTGYNSIDQHYDATIIGLLVFTGIGSFAVIIGCVFCFCLYAHLAVWCIDGCNRTRGGWVRYEIL
ncbi:hypothetical protein DPMN_076990 [Dreissena polymorpha]|uniref:Uncharacterized protein n=1 Tax=Dreissena polymorpha TaxID=45954 RepID=A0A9D3YL40_DREPO|nr:hypothetical protein DPMN_076990 [Dreissena polymorpha]